MAYFNTDTSARVGFRPYQQTNPFGAAHLSGVPRAIEEEDPGLGKYYMNRPFDPWELYSETARGLHGLGQNHPFKTQAWHLHGIGSLGDLTYAQALNVINSDPDAVESADGSAVVSPSNDISINTQTQVITLADGTVLTPPGTVATPVALPAQAATAGVPAGTELQYNAVRTPGFVWGAGDISSITAALKANWSIYVDNYALGSGTSPTLALQVHATVDYNLATDIQANIDHEIINSGRKIQSSTIAVIKAAPQVQQQNTQSLLAALATAQASGDTVTAQAILATLQSMGAAPAAGTSITAWIENNAVYIGIGVLAIFILPGLIKKL